MVREWGLTKFTNKLNSGRLRRRADPDTNLSDDDNAEFRYIYDHGTDMEAIAAI